MYYNLILYSKSNIGFAIPLTNCSNEQQTDTQTHAQMFHLISNVIWEIFNNDSCKKEFLKRKKTLKIKNHVIF